MVTKGVCQVFFICCQFFRSFLSDYGLLMVAGVVGLGVKDVNLGECGNFSFITIGENYLLDDNIRPSLDDDSVE